MLVFEPTTDELKAVHPTLNFLITIKDSCSPFVIDPSNAQITSGRTNPSDLSATQVCKARETNIDIPAEITKSDSEYPSIYENIKFLDLQGYSCNWSPVITEDHYYATPYFLVAKNEIYGVLEVRLPRLDADVETGFRPDAEYSYTATYYTNADTFEVPVASQKISLIVESVYAN